MDLNQMIKSAEGRRQVKPKPEGKPVRQLTREEDFLPTAQEIRKHDPEVQAEEAKRIKYRLGRRPAAKGGDYREDVSKFQPPMPASGITVGKHMLLPAYYPDDKEENDEKKS